MAGQQNVAAAGDNRADFFLPGRKFNAAQEIATLLAPAAGLGFNTALWTEEHICAATISPHTWVKHLKIIFTGRDVETMAAIADLGARMNYWEVRNLCTARQIFHFAFWLRRPEGAAALVVIAHRVKMMKKAPDGMRIEDVSYISMCNKLLAEMQNERAEKRWEMGKAIKNAECQLELAKKSKDAERRLELAKTRAASEEENVDRSYGVLAKYREPGGKAFDEDCWELYAEECTAKGMASMVKDGAGIRMVREHYGNVAKERRMAEFALQAENKEEIMQLIGEKTAYYESILERKKAQFFRIRWGIAFPNVPLAPPIPLTLEDIAALAGEGKRAVVLDTTMHAGNKRPAAGDLPRNPRGRGQNQAVADTAGGGRRYNLRNTRT